MRRAMCNLLDASSRVRAAAAADEELAALRALKAAESTEEFGMHDFRYYLNARERAMYDVDQSEARTRRARAAGLRE
jgi:hypothetical protein